MARTTNFEIGLGAYYRMDETGGTPGDAIDNEPGSYNLSDGAGNVPSQSPGWSGTARGAFTSSDVLSRSITASEPFDTVTNPNKSISFFCHVFLLTTGSDQTIWGIWDGASIIAQAGFARWNSISGKFEFSIGDGAGGSTGIGVVPSPTPPNGRWVPFGGSFDNATDVITVYADGNTAQATPSVSSWQNTVRHILALGALEQTGETFVNGYIDEFGWWDGVAFSPAQLAELDGLTRGSFTIPSGDEGTADLFVVETGLGLANATSYAGVNGFRNYWSLRGIPLPDESTKSIKGSLVQATDYLDRRYRDRFIGIRLNVNQSLEFPRVNAFYQDGRIAAGVVPEIEQATYELAFRAMSALLTPDPVYDDSNRVVVEKDEQVGPLREKTVFSSRNTTVLSYRKYPEIDGLLREFVTEGRILERA